MLLGTVGLRGQWPNYPFAREAFVAPNALASVAGFTLIFY